MPWVVYRCKRCDRHLDVCVNIWSPDPWRWAKVERWTQSGSRYLCPEHSVKNPIPLCIDGHEYHRRKR